MNRLPVTVVLRKEGGKLVEVGDIDKVRMDTFFKSLKEGEKMEATYEVIVDNHSYAQLSKLHKCIRELATDTGTSFEDMKKEVKIKCGMVNADKTLKSFSTCSRDDLSLAIQACIEIGEVVGVNLNTY